MNKTIKIIDLLNKIANGEEPSKKIKYNGELYHLNVFKNNYFNDLNCSFIDFENMHDTVEIIEDNDKTDEEAKPITKESIEALGYACGEIQKCFTSGWTKALENKPLKGNDKLEKINIKTGDDCKRFIEYDDETGHHKYTIRLLDEYFVKNINKIIDHINKIEERLDEK